MSHPAHASMTRSCLQESVANDVRGHQVHFVLVPRLSLLLVSSTNTLYLLVYMHRDVIIYAWETGKRSTKHYSD